MCAVNYPFCLSPYQPDTYTKLNWSWSWFTKFAQKKKKKRNLGELEKKNRKVGPLESLKLPLVVRDSCVFVLRRKVVKSRLSQTTPRAGGRSSAVYMREYSTWWNERKFLPFELFFFSFVLPRFIFVYKYKIFSFLRCRQNFQVDEEEWRRRGVPAGHTSGTLRKRGYLSLSLSVTPAKLETTHRRTWLPAISQLLIHDSVTAKTTPVCV